MQATLKLQQLDASQLKLLDIDLRASSFTLPITSSPDMIVPIATALGFSMVWTCGSYVAYVHVQRLLLIQMQLQL